MNRPEGSSNSEICFRLVGPRVQIYLNEKNRTERPIKRRHFWFTAGLLGTLLGRDTWGTDLQVTFDEDIQVVKLILC